MKLNLATLMTLMVAVARTAPVPGDNTLVDAEILNDSVKNVGNTLSAVWLTSCLACLGS